MNYVTSIFSSVKGYYDGINGATLTGALDVIVVRQPDGTFRSSSFHVRFGKLNVLQSNEKLVDITCNGRPVSLQMKLGANGEAFFVKQITEEDPEYEYADVELSTSPIQTDVPVELLRHRFRQETGSDEETDSSEYLEDEDDDDFYPYTGDDCLSDSELVTNQHMQQRLDNRPNRIVWDWGTLPRGTQPHQRGHAPAAASSSEEEGTSFIRGMWDYMGHRRKRKNTFTHSNIQEGIFLDDIDTDDPSAVSHYFGIDSSRRSMLYRAAEESETQEMFQNDEKFRILNALSLETPRYYSMCEPTSSHDASGISIQTQTPIMCKRNKRTQTADHPNHSDPEIYLSLCGDDLELFNDYIVTYDQINDDHLGILDDPNLMVKCGNDYYNWCQTPNDVLLAFAFREFRSVVEDDSVDYDGGPTFLIDDVIEEEVGGTKYIKVLTLTSDDLASLELENGSNTLTFTVTTSLQGTTRCTCHVYLWDHTDKIIISDIDGTITRSDVFGHILPWVGKDWTQNNIAKLYSALAGDGYKFLYLSSRAIGQASMTKAFLKSIKQNGQGIPEGPMLLSPDSLFRCLREELVLRRPHIFKIACLNDIKSLFGEDSAPFYGGFGNRTSDSMSYQAMGIPKHRVYIINHRGEIFPEHSLVQHCTYAEIYDHHEVYFPPLNLSILEVEEEYLSQNFWKPDIPELDESELFL